MTVAKMDDGEKWARRFHDAYERLAPDYGYETRKETREFDPQSANGKLMRAVVANVLHDFYDEHCRRTGLRLAEAERDAERWRKAKDAALLIYDSKARATVQEFLKVWSLWGAASETVSEVQP